MGKFRKYLAFFLLSLRHTFTNYPVWIGSSFFLITLMLIFAQIWKLAAVKKGIIGLHQTEILWYIALNQWIIVARPYVHYEIKDDLVGGNLACLLPRPVSYLWATFFGAVGQFTVNFIILGLVAFLFTWWQVGEIPFQILGFFILIFFAFQAGLLSILFRMIIGLIAFWIYEIHPIDWVSEKLLFVLGGYMLPLTIYPVWLQTLAHFTPFPVILGQRSALIFNFNTHDMFVLALTIFAWEIFAVLLLLLVYQKGLRNLTVEGG